MQPEQPTQVPLSLSDGWQNLSLQESGHWFESMMQAYPHHTDYGGVVWHGTYLTWMEVARVDGLRAVGLEYSDLVAQGCELPVIELAIRYHRSVQMGQTVVVKAKMAQIEGVRLHWDYQIQSLDRRELYVTARVTLVPVDREKGKILRRLPLILQEALIKLQQIASL